LNSFLFHWNFKSVRKRNKLLALLMVRLNTDVRGRLQMSVVDSCRCGQVRMQSHILLAWVL